MSLKSKKMNEKIAAVTQLETQDLDSICGGTEPYGVRTVSVRYRGRGAFQDINMRRLRRVVNPLDPIST